MKILLFNVYKVIFIHFNKQLPYEKTPDFLNRFTVCMFVTLYISLYGTIVFVIYRLISNSVFSLSKAIMWPSMLLGNYLVYLLLFKVLGLKNLNYLDPEHKPSAATIKNTWLIILTTAIITAIMLTIKVMVKNG